MAKLLDRALTNLTTIVLGTRVPTGILAMPATTAMATTMIRMTTMPTTIVRGILAMPVVTAMAMATTIPPIRITMMPTTLARGILAMPVVMTMMIAPATQAATIPVMTIAPNYLQNQTTSVDAHVFKRRMRTIWATGMSLLTQRWKQM